MNPRTSRRMRRTVYGSPCLFIARWSCRRRKAAAWTQSPVNRDALMISSDRCGTFVRVQTSAKRARFHEKFPVPVQRLRTQPVPYRQIALTTVSAGRKFTNMTSQSIAEILGLWRIGNITKPADEIRFGACHPSKKLLATMCPAASFRVRTPHLEKAGAKESGG
jgi:hypothetical protein